MLCKVVVSLILILEISFSSCSSIPKEDVITAHQSSDMVVVGQVEKKIFFISNNATRDGGWLDANYTRCRQAGLQFAKFENSQEENYVYSQVGSTRFWLAGCLKGQFDNNGNGARSQFAWNDGTQIANELNFLINVADGLCISYYNDVLYPTGCNTRLPTLCQLILP